MRRNAELWNERVCGGQMCMTMYVVALFVEDYDEEITDEFIEEIFAPYRFRISNDADVLELYDSWFRYPIIAVEGEEKYVSEAELGSINWAWTEHINMADDMEYPFIFRWSPARGTELSYFRTYSIGNVHEEIEGRYAAHKKFEEQCKSYAGQSRLLLFKFRLN